MLGIKRNEVVGWILTPLVVYLLASVSIQAERLPIRTYTTADGLAQNSVNRIVRDSRGFLWFCTDEGLSRFDGYTFTSYTTAQGLFHPLVIFAVTLTQPLTLGDAIRNTKSETSNLDVRRTWILLGDPAMRLR